MRRMLILFTFVGALFLTVGTQAQVVGSATISWSPSSSPNVAGYLIYYGTSSGNYISAVPVSGTATKATINGLISGVKYFFAASAVDGSGIQSSLSPEISGTVGSTVSAAALLTSALVNSPGQFSFTVAGVTGYKYVVQASTDLVNWVAIQTNIAPFNFVDSNRSQFNQRFYRTVYNPNL